MLRAMADGLQGRFVLNPVTALFNRFITVHPLGGCAMGTTSAEGVVDVRGRVHGHPNLHVVDGAALPGPVGANPSLTDRRPGTPVRRPAARRPGSTAAHSSSRAGLGFPRSKANDAGCGSCEKTPRHERRRARAPPAAASSLPQHNLHSDASGA